MNGFKLFLYRHTLLLFYQALLAVNNFDRINQFCCAIPKISFSNPPYSIICSTTGLSEVSLQNVFERSSFDSTRGGLPPALLLSEEEFDEAAMLYSPFGAGTTETGIITVFLAVRPPAPP